ncbi:MAG TPA: leucyl aminopeptidase, partial [Candidatus Andersenbacteria bacterium]|nr:leucyl aminopeptidase [Candidatus Andersenbacteria bacterium]
TADAVLLPASSAPAAVRARVRALGFTGGWGTASLVTVRERGVAAPWLGLLGLGPQGQAPEHIREGMRRAVAQATRESRRHGVRVVVVDLRKQTDAAALATAAVEGAVLANYRFTEHSTRLQQQQRQQAVRRLYILVAAPQQAVVRAALRETQQILPGVLLARQLVNEPAEHMTPVALVRAAREVAKSAPEISVKILDRAAAAKQNFSAFLAVARGSQEEPYVIHLTYKPRRAAQGSAPLKKIFLIGKGITFDSGGLSLKPGSTMESMKIDMAGAAAVLGVFSVLANVNVNVEVQGVIAACENMPSGTAYRPGDVLKTKSGKTIEVFSTDAEGRVTLADAMTYALEQQPDAMIDVATLTGSSVVGLGETHAGLWSSSTALGEALLGAAREAGEGLVLLPLPEEYKPMIQSQVADLRNTATTRYGDAIMAALFLQEFSGTVPWAHLDIAGPAYAEREILPYWQHNCATGYGVRTLIEFLKSYQP